MYCGKCGNQLSEGSVFCDKCGSKVIVKQEVAKDLSKDKRKKGIKGIIISVIVAGFSLAAVVCVCVLVAKSASERQGYYRGFKWGMTKDEVKTHINKEFDVEFSVSDISPWRFEEKRFRDKRGVTAQHSFNFGGPAGLWEIFINIGIEKDSKYSYSDIAEEIGAEFNRLYGKAKEEKYDVDTLQYYKKSEWITKRSVIVLTETSAYITIAYAEINHVNDIRD